MRIDRKSNSWLGTERFFCGCFQSKVFCYFFVDGRRIPFPPFEGVLELSWRMVRQTDRHTDGKRGGGWICDEIPSRGMGTVGRGTTTAFLI